MTNRHDAARMTGRSDTTTLRPTPPIGRSAWLMALCVAAAALAFQSIAAPPPGHTSAPTPPTYPDSSYSVFLPYTNVGKTPSSRVGTPRLTMSFGGKPVNVTMDTGSTGIVVSADAIPGERGLPGRPGHVTYTSSGRVMSGRWVRTPLFIQGAGESALAIHPIEVLAVTRMTCLAHARDCKPKNRPTGVAMMGVGFGREYNLQPEGTPDKNPFLNVAWPADAVGRVTRGYMISRDGVHVGLTAQVTRGTIRYVRLTPDNTVKGEWQGVPACVSVDPREPAACGSGLVDTGVTGMFVTLPASQLDHRRALPAKATLTVSFPHPAETGADPADGLPAAQYSVSPRDKAVSMSPSAIVVNTSRPTPFVNTGVRFLEGYDVLYDADRGYFGFRPR